MDHWNDQLLDEQQMMSLARGFMYTSDSWPTAAPDGWLDADNRVFHTRPYISSVEEVTEHIANYVNEAAVSIQDLVQFFDGQNDILSLDDFDQETFKRLLTVFEQLEENYDLII